MAVIDNKLNFPDKIKILSQQQAFKGTMSPV
jgi:hypothetical protein